MTLEHRDNRTLGHRDNRKVWVANLLQSFTIVTPINSSEVRTAVIEASVPPQGVRRVYFIIFTTELYRIYN